MSEYKWDRHFLDMALAHSVMSKDPNKKAGAVIVGPDREIRSMGFNGFPRGVEDHWRRLEDRELKNRWMVHAETNAIYNAARVGVPLKDCTIYFTLNDDTGPHGGCPCLSCMAAIIQVGIKLIVSFPFKSGNSNWLGNLQESETMFREARIHYREIPLVEPERSIPREVKSCECGGRTDFERVALGPHHRSNCPNYTPF